MRKIRDQKGFTLIELMIVVVIIGILAALAIPRFNQASRQARAAEADPILGQICTMANVYYERFSANGSDLASLSVVGLATPAATTNYSGYAFAGAGEGFGTATATGVPPLVNKTMNCQTRAIAAAAP